MVDEFSQAQVPGEGGRHEQAGIGHQAMVVKEDADTVGFVLWQHLLGAPCFRAVFCSKTIIPDSEEHPLASSWAVPKAVIRWIRGKWNDYADKRHERVKAQIDHLLRSPTKMKKEGPQPTGWILEDDKVIVIEQTDTFGRREFDWENVPSTLIDDNAQRRRADPC